MYERTLIASFDCVEAAVDASMSVFNSYVMPLAMTVFDPRVASHIGLDEGVERHHLAVRLGGRTRTLARQVDEISAMFAAAGASSQRQSEGPGPSVWRPLSDFGWSPETTPILNIRITALPSRICDILKMVPQLRDSGLEPAALAEPGFGTVEANWFAPGDVSRHSRESGNPRRGSPLGNLQEEAVMDIIAKVRKRVSRLGGTAVVQRCPSDVKAGLDVWGEDHPGIDVMRRMKRRYDPNGIMNPGRFVGRI